LKDALRLAVYFATVILVGALVAPFLYWSAQILARQGPLHFLAQFDFEVFFHRALLVGALIFFWPLLRSVRVRRLTDVGLRVNEHRWRDLITGFVAALLPLALCGVALVAAHVYSLRSTVDWTAVARTVAAAIAVPCIEEVFFRGLILGILLRSGRKYLSMFLTSALFSIVHFLKAPEGTSPVVTWTSGFQSITHSLAQFSEPTLVLAGFTTLFLIGWVLADARIRTASLWLPIGLHAGWILGNGVFNRIARREFLLLPWLGRNLLVGLIPLGVICLTWVLVRFWNREKRI
jgi:membrane protease YdiL (CAAX protease family)